MKTYEETPPMTDDIVLQEWLGEMLERARVHRVWLFFLDGDDRVQRTMMPIDDYPADPNRACVTPDLGMCTHAEVFASRFADMMGVLDATQIVLVWERRGKAALSTRDAKWPTALGRALRAEGVQVRGQFLLHSRGVRQLTPDDLPELIG
mgnify:CR=1 FL=1